MKNEIYILHQPKHSILSIVLVDKKEFPLSEHEHQSISEIQEFSDIMFVFPWYAKGIQPEKFTSLYGGCGWIRENDSLIETYMKTILYGLEIFERHVGFCISRLSDLGKIQGKIQGNKILTLTASNMSSAVFKTRKLNSDEFYEIYKESRINSIFRPHDTSNMYASYTSDSAVLYFKRSNVGTIVDFWKSSDNNKYIKSFILEDPRYFFASVCKFLNISTIDSDIQDLDIGMRV